MCHQHGPGAFSAVFSQNGYSEFRRFVVNVAVCRDDARPCCSHDCAITLRDHTAVVFAAEVFNINIYLQFKNNFAGRGNRAGRQKDSVVEEILQQRIFGRGNFSYNICQVSFGCLLNSKENIYLRIFTQAGFRVILVFHV